MARAGLTRALIIDAGAQLADARGFEAVTLAELARQFSVKLASLYSHLKNSDDLKTGIALLALDTLADRAADCVAGRSGKDALIALANVHRDFAREHPGLFQAARHPLDAETAATSGGARLSRLNQAMLRGYALSEANRVHATRLLGSFFLGFSLLEMAGSFAHSSPAASTSWAQSLDGLDALLRGWADA